MQGLSGDAKTRMEQMRANYAASLSAKWDEIEVAWQSCVNERWQGETAKELKSLVHKLSGSAGLYGFGDLGAAARDVDLALVDMSAESDSVDQITRLMQCLESCFAQASE